MADSELKKLIDEIMRDFVEPFVQLFCNVFWNCDDNIAIAQSTVGITRGVLSILEEGLCPILKDYTEDCKKIGENIDAVIQSFMPLIGQNSEGEKEDLGYKFFCTATSSGCSKLKKTFDLNVKEHCIFIINTIEKIQNSVGKLAFSIVLMERHMKGYCNQLNKTEISA